MALYPSEPKTLATTAAACNGWYASLLFLRNGFTCDMALFKTDITMPGEVTKGGSTALSFRYPPSNGEDQAELVKKAMEVQRSRKSQRAQDFADELSKVYEYISEKTRDQFQTELAHATAFTDGMAIRSAPSGKKRKKDVSEDAVKYAPPVRRSQSKQPVVVTPRPYVATSLLNQSAASAASDNSAPNSKRASRSSIKRAEDAIKREVDETVERLLEAYSDKEE